MPARSAQDRAESDASRPSPRPRESYDEARANRPGKAGIASPAKSRVLLVDAQASVRLALSKVLIADDYDVEEAETGGRRGSASAPPGPTRSSRAAGCRTGARSSCSLRREVGRPVTPCLVLAEPDDSRAAAVEALVEGAEQFLIEAGRPAGAPPRPPARRWRTSATGAGAAGRVGPDPRARRPVPGQQPRDPRPGRAGAASARTSERPVLIRGETGTGKGVLAAWLHAQRVPRAKRCSWT